MTFEDHEVDIDAWASDAINLDEGQPAGIPGAAEAVGPVQGTATATVSVGREPVPMQQLTMEGTEVPIAPANVPDPVGFIFPSRSGRSSVHVVTLMVLGDEAATRVVACNCEAMRNLNRRPAGCWAMSRARAILRLPEPQ